MHRNETSYRPLRFASWCATTYRSDLSILSGGVEEEEGGVLDKKGGHQLWAKKGAACWLRNELTV